ncbi:deoxyxylulose-5-phosphate synthase [Sulfobacillus acidophilus TPY]|uniref:1-deoxy-D-xylulose-5-phosphate synthase n=1 Tax=Sulfobacillus acidophilus (strain ATCC 700253 / DSM 10332 / NAL) TaxID=679936 RepID=G8TYU0_SULAD|nr:deoxyxylulose-5-phosphate synthase [Sulfobacillus acidophilus TPY]AEW05119.1 1-deoxy-D-xylulose-5-phosphate synthase [Sulfobacillus acidophilus DSM 10332]
MGLLDHIHTPNDFRHFTISQLEALAREVRQTIIETTAKTGGHIGASLGAVELAIALHYVYHTPEDQLVWDIGHQAYAHKILTGRYAEFPTIRQLHGLSGFLKRRESVYDVWEAGHAGTSLSGALGLAVARDKKHEHFRVVTVIGDGALTAGMTWEALNQIGHLKTRLVIVINDNSMSIAPNVGAFSRYLTDLRSWPGYARLKQEVESLLDGIPVFGGSLKRSIERVKDLLHYAVLAGNVFEELGFKYFGPLDGHDLDSLIPVLANAANFDGPVVVHVVTQKGRGYKPAEEAPVAFHGPGPFEVSSGKMVKKAGPPSYSQVFSQTLIEIARVHPEVVAITAAMPDGTKLDLFQREFPDRFYDVGIAEQHAATFAAGLALGGMRPVFAVYSTFLQRAYDQVVHDICHQDLPVILGVDRAGLVGGDGATHQGIYDLAFLRTVPNIEIAMGKDEAELRQLLWAALDRPHPVAIRYPRGAGRGLDLSGPVEPLVWGSGEWLAAGEDLTILALGPLVYTALEVREILRTRGIAVGVVNARFVKPLDEALLHQVLPNTRAVVTLEEHARAGGFGSAVLEWMAGHGYRQPVLIQALPDEFIDHGPREYFLDQFGLTTDALARLLESFLARLPQA